MTDLYKGLQATHAKEAVKRFQCNSKIVQRLAEFYRPRSILDVGCSLGYFLEAAGEELDSPDVLGVDGPWTQPDALRFPPAFFRVADLGQPLDLGRRFDLVVSLEVAEHIEAGHSDIFIDSLTRHGDVVLFSAAIPGQGGTGHINEQHLSYWSEKFGRRGFRPVDLFREVFWSDGSMFPWFRQNLMLFTSDAFLTGADWAKTRVIDPGLTSIVHPTYYNAKVRELNALHARFQAVTEFLSQPLPRLRKHDRQIAKIGSTELRSDVFAPVGIDVEALDDVGCRVLTDFCDRQGLLSLALEIGRHLLARAKSISPRDTLRQADRLEHMGRWGEAELLVRDAASRLDDPRLIERLARQAVDSHRFDEAEALSSGLGRGKASAISTAISETRAFAKSESSTVPVFVVNLPSDIYRRRSMEARLAWLGASFEVIKAIRPDYPPPELKPLLRVEDALDGSYGNQMTQYMLWRRLSEELGTGWALILEDDAFLRARPPDPSSLDFEGGTDIIFANDRLASARLKHSGPGPRLQKLSEELSLLSADKPQLSAPGSDAYFINAAGAEKLVRIVEHEGFARVGTDWLLVSHAVQPEEVDALAEGSILRRTLSRRARDARHSPIRLSGRVLAPALASHRPFGVARTHRTLD
jgi:SAM-dependent methyltransferase